MKIANKFADVVGWISNNDEMEYRKEIENLVNWCSNNNLSLNVNKTKETVIDFRKRSGGHAPVHVNGDEVEWSRPSGFSVSRSPTTCPGPSALTL